ncbi:tRNA cyclic N6-threonylcarbamoyladenosine(37) synthase TcdA [Marinomonas agarivorans]|nr:tRNA cyclic N6-threonylcarbamoyladenosine(37) synthase TcdA [Marinomonas agarivorans]
MTADQRFGGIQRLYGEKAYQFFCQARVMVIGIGGVGTWAAEALARSGIGHLTLVDMDDVCITNVNRQIHALDGTVGQAKVEVMAARIKLINPACQVHVIEDFLTPDNIEELLAQPYDYVIDAIDSLKPKAALIAWCRRHKQKLITVGGAGGQIDPTQVQIADLSRTEQDPLAAKLRNYLRRHYHFPRNPQRRFEVECVYSTEQLRYPQGNGEVGLQRPKNGESGINCDTGFGSCTPVTASFGFVAAGRVLMKLAQRAEQE